MKIILGYLFSFFSSVNKKHLLLCTVFISALIFINYNFDLESQIIKNIFPVKLLQWFIVFAVAFIIPYITHCILKNKNYFTNYQFAFLLFLAPLIFAIKVSIDFHFNFSADPLQREFWDIILYWPLLVAIVLFLLYITWLIFDKKTQAFYGSTRKDIEWRPYFLMLLIMLPLIAAAATQDDFLSMYPKLQVVKLTNEGSFNEWWKKLLFEISYGTDFISIEFFFRGFLVLAFIKWAGKDAILPMACFYCTIHFGKPLAECISSYFGGIILGIIVYNTRSVYGGLIVHLGIAWMMELAGYLGRL